LSLVIPYGYFPKTIADPVEISCLLKASLSNN